MDESRWMNGGGVELSLSVSASNSKEFKLV